MSKCPQCGIDRQYLNSPCLICGYADGTNNAPPECQNNHPETKQCPFCGETIQFVAKKCKHCGEFLSGQNNAQNEQVQTIERTSKNLKAQIMLSSMLTIVSLLFTTGGCSASNFNMAGLGLTCFLVGLVWFISVRFRIWWNHG